MILCDFQYMIPTSLSDFTSSAPLTPPRALSQLPDALPILLTSPSQLSTAPGRTPDLGRVFFLNFPSFSAHSRSRSRSLQPHWSSDAPPISFASSSHPDQDGPGAQPPKCGRFLLQHISDIPEPGRASLQHLGEPAYTHTI